MTETETLVESTKQLALSSSEEPHQTKVELDGANGNRTVNVDDDDDEESTPNHSSDNHNHNSPEHPLEFEWTFWYDKRPAQGKRLKGEQDNYESNLRPIGTFGTVEDFWRYYNHLVKPSKLELNANYHFFKNGIKPMWEDSENSKGGKWVLTFKDKNLLDACWENVVLSLVGETLDAQNEINGAVVSRRKAGDRIAIWNKRKDNETAIISVGAKLKALLGVDPSKVNSSYQSHEDSMRTGASFSNPAHYKM